MKGVQRMKLKQRIRQTIVIVFICAMVSSNVYAITSGITITVPQQEKTNWCWAACSLACIRYYGYSNNVQQSDVAFFAIGSSTLDRTASLNEVCSGLYAWNIASAPYAFSIPLQDSTYGIVEEINASHPILASGGNHMVVITSYLIYENGNSYVGYRDPANPDAGVIACTYSTNQQFYIQRSWGIAFCDGFINNIVRVQ